MNDYDSSNAVDKAGALELDHDEDAVSLSDYGDVKINSDDAIDNLARCLLQAAKANNCNGSDYDVNDDYSNANEVVHRNDDNEDDSEEVGHIEDM